MIDFEWYRSFVAVYQTGTVSAGAAQRLMTQPALTQHLAALERALDVKLFQRTPRQMIPTAEGKALYARVIGAVEQLETLSDPKNLRFGNQLPKLKIGAPREYFTIEGLARLAKQASETANVAAVEMEIVPGQTAGLIKVLEKDELDAVIASQRITRGSIHYLPLRVEHFLLVAPLSIQLPDGLSNDEMITWLAGLTWIAYAPELPIIRRYWLDAFERRPNFAPRLIMPDLLMILRAVSLGLGVSILPDYLCAEALQRGAIHVLWRPDRDPSNPLYLAVKRSRLHDPAIVWLGEVLGITDKGFNQGYE